MDREGETWAKAMLLPRDLGVIWVKEPQPDYINSTSCQCNFVICVFVPKIGDLKKASWLKLVVYLWF